jgi:hypothetical protein
LLPHPTLGLGDSPRTNACVVLPDHESGNNASVHAATVEQRCAGGRDRCAKFSGYTYEHLRQSRDQGCSGPSREGPLRGAAAGGPSTREHDARTRRTVAPGSSLSLARATNDLWPAAAGDALRRDAIVDRSVVQPQGRPLAAGPVRSNWTD